MSMNSGENGASSSQHRGMTALKDGLMQYIVEFYRRQREVYSKKRTLYSQLRSVYAVQKDCLVELRDLYWKQSRTYTMKEPAPAHQAGLDTQRAALQRQLSEVADQIKALQKTIVELQRKYHTWLDAF